MSSSSVSRIAPALVLSLFFASVASPAADLFVDQKHAKADDKNSGAEALPFKTIQKGCDSASAGDTIWVKEGVYDEIVEIHKSGTWDAPITLSAWKEDRVVLGSVLKEAPKADQWKPIPKSKSWAATLPEEPPKDVVVILDGEPIVTQRLDTPPLDKNANWATYRASDKTLMIHAGGDNPGNHRLQLARKMCWAICLREKYGSWAFKKLEFAWMDNAVIILGTDVLIEDCYFHNMYHSAIFPHGRLITIRRCNFRHCQCAVSASGSGAANIIEDNLAVDCGGTAEQDISCRERNIDEGASAFEFKGDAFAQIFRYNVLADNLGGLWYDGAATGCRVIGNAFLNNEGAGIYNEYSADDTLVIGNYFLRDVLASSWCTRMHAYDNFFEGGCVVWHNRDIYPLRHSFMTLRGNAFIDCTQGYLLHFGRGWGPGYYPEGFTNSLVDFNRFRIRKDVPWINDGGEKVWNLDDIRKKYGWEMHGDGKVYDPKNNDLTPEAMGATTVTFRVPFGPRTHLSRPMLADGAVKGVWPAAVEMGDCNMTAFFWRISDGNYSERTLWPYETYAQHDARWQVNSSFISDKDTNNGCTWHIDAQRTAPEELKKRLPPGALDKAEFPVLQGQISNGNRWLLIRGVDPEKIPAQGVGWWSPPLPTIEGAKINISMKVRGKDIVSSAKGSPAAWVQFINETGRNRQRVFLVGGEPGGKPVRPELTKGSFDWTLVKDTITAPPGAVRMALFMGVLPCKGEVNFDDIGIKTDPGPAPAQAEKEAILPPRLPLERFKETIFVDLSKFANRGLADAETDDGKGGWTDQGPSCDMRALKTGRRKFGGVSFEILPEPKAIVVLKSSQRKSTGMPERVAIPVGRKLHTLFFLHAAAWCPSGESEAFRYVLHYKDGRNVELIVSGKNLADWAAKPVKRFAAEEKTFSTVALTVPNEQFGRGSIYRMEWNSPDDRRQVELESIEFVGQPACVPVLLAITGIIEW